MEGGTSGNPNSMMGLGESSCNNNNNNNNNFSINMNGVCSIMMMNSSAGTSTDDGKVFLPPLMMPLPPRQQQVFFTDINSNSMKAKIMAHPHFPRLLSSYVSCQKVGAPPQVLARLEEACASGEAMNRSSAGTTTACVVVGDDPALDQFMEAYCEMLTKYEQELTKPFKEAVIFLSEIESQLKTLTVSSHISGRSGSLEEEIDVKDQYIDPLAEDGELKGQLLRKYSGSLGDLKQEFLKKKKKGKLPKEARHQLLDWWSRHHRWPYPSEPQKLALAESTGLDLKQINNWFINQRKRHWKPSEDMQFVMMDATTYPQYYMENVSGGNPFPLDCAPPAHF